MCLLFRVRNVLFVLHVFKLVKLESDSRNVFDFQGSHLRRNILSLHQNMIFFFKYVRAF